MSNYPALLDLATKQLYPLKDVASFVAGRSQDADLPLPNVACSRKQFRLVREGDRYCIEALSSNSPTYCNGKPVEAKVPLSHGMILQAGECKFRFVDKEEEKQ